MSCGLPKGGGAMYSAGGSPGSADKCGQHQSEDNCKAETADDCKWSNSGGSSVGGDFGDMGGGGISVCSAVVDLDDCNSKLVSGKRVCSWESMASSTAGGLGGDLIDSNFKADGNAGAGGAAGIGNGGGDGAGTVGGGVDQTGDAGAVGGDVGAVGTGGDASGFCGDYDECRAAEDETACGAIANTCAWDDASKCRGSSSNGMPGGASGPRCADKSAVSQQAGEFVATTKTTTTTTTTTAEPTTATEAAGSEEDAGPTAEELQEAADAAAVALAAANTTKLEAEATVAGFEEQQEEKETEMEAANDEVGDEDCGSDPAAEGISEACVKKLVLEQQLAVLAAQLAAAQAELATAKAQFEKANDVYVAASHKLGDAPAVLEKANQTGMIIGIAVGAIAVTALVVVLAMRGSNSKDQPPTTNGITFHDTGA